MKQRVKLAVRVTAICAGLLLLLGLGAPFLRANRLRSRVQAALESALDRRVEFESVQLDLFNGPGVQLTNVQIFDKPEFGVEPMAYVDSLEARVSFASLWRERLVFDKLRMINPSLNLVKSREGVWNIQALISSAALATRAGRSSLPELLVRGGRLNFKTAERKSPFYFGDADIDLTLPEEAGLPVLFRFHGQPGWTGQGAAALGTLSGLGRVSAIQSEPHLELDLQLEKSSISDSLYMIAGTSLGAQGLVGSRVHIAGPLSRLGVSGQLQLENVNRSTLAGFISGPLRATFGGEIDLYSQRLSLETDEPSKTNLPVVFQVEATSLFQQPRWTTSIKLQDLTASSLLPVVRQLGFALPDPLQVEGKLSGRLGYASPGGAEGRLALNDVSWQLPGSGQVKLSPCELTMEQGTAHTGLCSAALNTGRIMSVQMEYNAADRRLDLDVKADGAATADLYDQARGLGISVPPLFSSLTGGVWTGALHYHSQDQQDPIWTGAFDLSDATAAVPGLADPFHLKSAEVELEGVKVSVNRIRASAGALLVDGDYAYVPESQHPHVVRLSVVAPDLPTVEAELLPALQRRSSLIARTLRLTGSKVPEWLAGQHCEGFVRLRLRNPSADVIQTRVTWDGAQIRLTGITGKVEGAAVRGSVAVDLREGSPRYQLRGRVKGLPWAGGALDGEGSLVTSGVGQDLLANLESAGTFTGKSITAGTELPIRSATGQFFVSSRKGARFESLQVAMGPENFTGRGDTAALNRVQFDLTNGAKQLRLSGSLQPFQLEIAP